MFRNSHVIGYMVCFYLSKCSKNIWAKRWAIPYISSTGIEELLGSISYFLFYVHNSHRDIPSIWQPELLSPGQWFEPMII